MTTRRDLAACVRFLAADMIDSAASGHPGLPLGFADVATVLWSEFLRFDAGDPDWPDRDRFVLSAGHGSAMLYALAWLCGVAGVELDHLRAFRQLGSPTAGHPEHGHFPSAETTTGPLGQGIANAVGMAIAEAKTRAEFGTELCDHRTWVVAGDGCLMEGISHEAISLAGHLRLDRLTVLWDDNRITIDGSTDLSTSDDQIARFEASGWRAVRVDGHDLAAIAEALTAATECDRPTLVACRTTIGCGAPNVAGTPLVHGSPLGAAERAAMADSLGWTFAPFDIPADLLAAWRTIGRRGSTARRVWESAAAGPTGAELRDRLLQPVTPRVVEQLDDHRRHIREQAPTQATRVSSRDTIGALVPVMPSLLGGSADLSESNGARSSDHTAFSAEHRLGNYVQYGIREHAMAACMNGIALHGGYLPYGSTFLVFSDYARPAVRLAALMELPVIHVMTHDSIGVGEDGPTHQPVEHLCALRAIPNLLVIRPADALETVDAWAEALRQTRRPTVLVLSRQSLAPLGRDDDRRSTVRRGGTRVAGDDEPQVTLLASGSEVGVAMAARAMLADVGVRTAVVSMPCLELFAEQSEDYRRRVLGDVPRVVIEASTAQSWWRFLDRADRVVGMTGFGASGRAADLFEHFGITPSRVYDEALDLLSIGDCRHREPTTEPPTTRSPNTRSPGTGSPTIDSPTQGAR